MEVFLAALVVHINFSWHNLAALAVETSHFQHKFGFCLSESHLVINIH